MPLNAAMQQLVELEYTAVEIMVHHSGGHIQPAVVLADMDSAIAVLPSRPTD